MLLATLARERACCPGMEPHFALCFSGRLSEQLTEFGTAATLLGSVQTRFPWQVWQAQRRLARLLREQAFEVVICHMAWAQAIFGPAVRRAKLPLVYWMHDAAEENIGSNAGRLSARQISRYATVDLPPVRWANFFPAQLRRTR